MIAVTILTVMFMLQLLDANIMFIMVQMAMIFFGHRSCSRLSLGDVRKYELEIEEAFIIIFCNNGGINFQLEISSHLSSSSSISFSFALSKSACIVDSISLCLRKPWYDIPSLDDRWGYPWMAAVICLELNVHDARSM